MGVSIPNTGTEYVANELTITRGSVLDITFVGVYHTKVASYIPNLTDFTEVQLVQPGDPLAEGQRIDILSLIGARSADVTLPPGTYQRWVRVSTATEDILRRPDTITVT